jgi:hypothetical protein
MARESILSCSTFAVCHGHTAKHRRHTANPLPWVAYGKPHTASNLTANAMFAVGQGAGMCVKRGTRQTKMEMDGTSTLGRR